MDNQKEILSAKEHFAAPKPQKKRTQQKLTKADKQKGIIDGKQKLKSDVDLGDNDLLYKIADSDGKSMDPKNLPEYMSIDLELLHKLLECELCKGIPRKVKTIKNCLHRFCAECIDKWFKLGNKVCPVCQKKCPRKHAVVEDHNRNNLVAACFPNREVHESQDEDTQLLKDDDKSLEKKPECGVTSTPYFPSEEMLERVAKQVMTAIINHKKKLAQLPPRSS